MSEQKPPGAAGYLSQILSYVDSPFRLAAIVILFIVGGLGWIAYQHSDEFVERWMTPSATSLKTDAVPDALGKLAEETSADLIQIWSVDLSSNSQSFIAARRHDGERPVIPSPRRLPIMDHASDIRRLVDILEGHPVCVELLATGTPVARRLAERGMKRGCAIPIPPAPDSFVGVVYLAWQTPVDASAENVAVGAAREIAAKLVSR